MANRHQRRKRAAARKAQILIGQAQYEHSKFVAETVKRNKSLPVGTPVLLVDQRTGVGRIAYDNHSIPSSVAMCQTGRETKGYATRKDLYDPKHAKRIAEKARV